jgi:hypothetical protein
LKSGTTTPPPSTFKRGINAGDDGVVG